MSSTEIIATFTTRVVFFPDWAHLDGHRGKGPVLATFQKPQKNQSNFILPLSSLIKTVQETLGHDMSFPDLGWKKENVFFSNTINLRASPLPHSTSVSSQRGRHLLQRHRHFPRGTGCPF